MVPKPPPSKIPGRGSRVRINLKFRKVRKGPSLAPFAHIPAKKHLRDSVENAVPVACRPVH